MSATPNPESEPLYKTRTIIRRAGYAALPGEWFSYILHLRPREWPIMAAHTALGFLLATGFGALRDTAAMGSLGFALFVWVILLNGGTLAINSAFDRDEGDIGYLDVPPPVPRNLLPFSIVLMVSGQLLAYMVSTSFALVYAACFGLSLLYSVPPFRFKAVAGADWVINMVGFGTLTPVAGWLASGVPLNAAGLWVMMGFVPLFAGFYPLTQIYQFEEDSARGDKTLALAIGARGSLWLAIGTTIVAFVVFAHGFQLAGRPGWSFQLLLVALAVWLMVLVRWLLKVDSMTSTQEKRGMYQALLAWGITDIVVVVAFVLNAGSGTS